jgi:hypothetical protein
MGDGLVLQRPRLQAQAPDAEDVFAVPPMATVTFIRDGSGGAS